MEKRFVYADNSATTRVSKRALDAALPYYTEKYGNPSSIYGLGMSAARDLLDARTSIAAQLGADASELFFTSGGSESDNWAIRGAAEIGAAKGKKHIITTNVEHHAVLHTCEYLQKQGFEITYLPVDEGGLITPEQVAAAIREDTALVTVMYANNEIGTVFPIAEIAKVCKEKGVLFHTDAVQAVGHLAINVKELGVDMLSLSGHKFHSPKGVGALYIRKGLRLKPLIYGGAQESGRRAGTENLPSIVAMNEALKESLEDIDAKNERIKAMRERLIDGLLKVPDSRLNGDREHRMPGNANISFLGIEGESLLLMLDLYGIQASSGSACTTASLDPSHVLLAIGLKHAVAHGSLRLSINDENTDEDIDYIIETVPKVVEKLRAMSPLWETYQKEGKHINDIQ